MASVNKIILVGNLGSKPELRRAGETPVTTLNIATTEKWKAKDGTPQEETTWHYVDVWGVAAENACKYLDKGRSVYVEGGLRKEKYEKDGVEKEATKVRAHTVQYLGGNPNAQGQQSAEAPPF